MRLRSSESRAEAFGNYWDAFVGGAPADEVARLRERVDPTLIAATERVRADYRPLPADPAFATRLERELVQAFHADSITPRPSLVAERLRRERIGRAAPWHPPAAAGNGERPKVFQGAHFALRWLTAALLLLVTVAGIYRSSWGDRAPGGSHNGVVVPAPSTPCGANGADTGAPSGSPVPVTLTVASPVAGTTTAVSFVWAANGRPAGSLVGGYEGIAAMAIDPHCQLWVMDVSANHFLIYDLDGHLLDTWGTAGSGDGQFSFGGDGYYGGFAFASDGGFYVADRGNRRVQQFDANRQFVRTWNVTSSTGQAVVTPLWIAVGPDGNVYVVADETTLPVQVFSPDGVLIRRFGGPNTGPIAFDPAGNPWMLKPDLSHLEQFSPTGELLATIDQSTAVGYFPIGFAIDGTGRFYIADGNQDRVSVFDPTGTLLYSWGAAGTDDGQFRHHSLIYIALDGTGGVYTDEFGDERIQKFQVRP